MVVDARQVDDDPEKEKRKKWLDAHNKRSNFSTRKSVRRLPLLVSFSMFIVCPGAERIPPETLVAILSQLSQNELICASHVSSYWRSVAICVPLLWTKLQLVTPQATASTAEFLVRSDKLEFSLQIQHLLTSAAHHSVEQGFRRLTLLSLALDQQLMQTLCDNLNFSTAPNLTCLLLTLLQAGKKLGYM